MLDTGLRDKVVLITGGNHGIGDATARTFAVQGARVFITYLRLSPRDFGIDPGEARKASAPGLPLYHAAQTRSADEVVGRSAAGEVGSSRGRRISRMRSEYRSSLIGRKRCSAR